MSSDERLDHALDALDRLSGEAPWRSPDQIRRTARRRTITRRSLLGAGALAVAGGVVESLLPRASSPTRSARAATGQGATVQARSGAAVELVADVRPLPTTAGDLAPVATAEQQFALDLLRVVPASSANVVLSPSSLATALAMLQLGAAGTTRDQLARALHTERLSSEQQALGWAALTNSLAGTGVVESANSVWQQRNFPSTPGYLPQLARYFRTGVWQVDFHNDMPAALAAIDAWCSKQTHGRITKLFEPGQLDPATTVLVLANAEYFKAAWKYKLDPGATRDGPFHRGDGSTVQVPFMRSAGLIGVSDSKRYLAVQLPYAGGRFAAQLIMPLHGSLADLIGSLTPSDFADIAAARPGDVTVLFPKFSAQTVTDLLSPLQKLGVTAAFGPAADFSLLSPRGVSVEAVVQRDFLKVDEVGTEAAAVTGVGVQVESLRPPTAFDRPFLFLVRDTQTGTVLFAGQIVDPSAS